MFKVIKTKKLNKLLPNFENSSEIMRWDKSDHIQFAAFFQNPNGNYGDRIIPRLAVDLIDHFLTAPPYYRYIQAKSGNKSLAEYDKNQAPIALIIGPGGIISGRAEKSEKSDYKWFINFNSEEAKKLKSENIPIFFWGSGVNRWSNKRLFTEDVKADIREMFGYIDLAFIRGKTDIDFLKTFIAEKDHHKLIFQVCPSFFIPELRNIKQRSQTINKRVAINISGDQLFEYFKLPSHEVLNWKHDKDKYFKMFSTSLSPFIKYLERNNLTPVFFCNTTQDSVFANDFFPKIERIDTHTVSPEYVHLEQLLSTYSYAVGMRLHAWLPFLSLGIPAIFLTPFKYRAQMPNDLNLPDLSCYIQHDKELNLIETFEKMLQNETFTREELIKQKELWLTKTQEHITMIMERIELKKTESLSQF